jgi:hypothetical protein
VTGEAKPDEVQHYMKALKAQADAMTQRYVDIQRWYHSYGTHSMECEG